MAKNLFSFSLVILLIVVLFAGSCAPKSRTIIPLRESDKSSIKKVAINVQVSEELITASGRMYDCKGAACMLVMPVVLALMITEGPVIVLAAMILDETVSRSARNEKAQRLRKDISDVQMDKLMSERIDEHFETSQVPFEAEISEIQSPSILAQQGFDTMLDITIEKLDIKLCPRRVIVGYDDHGPIVIQEITSTGVGPLSSDDEEYRPAVLRWNEIYPDYFWKTNMTTKEFLYSTDATRVSKKEQEEIENLALEIEELKPVIEEYKGDTVRTWITFKANMISTRDGRVLWDREELYFYPRCESVEEMQKNPEVLVDMLIRSIHDIAVNTVNQIQ